MSDDDDIFMFLIKNPYKDFDKFIFEIYFRAFNDNSQSSS